MTDNIIKLPARRPKKVRTITVESHKLDECITNLSRAVEILRTVIRDAVERKSGSPAKIQAITTATPRQGS